MFDDSRSFISRAFLQSILDLEFKAYVAEGIDIKVLAALKVWDERHKQRETQDESAFIQTFFAELWNYGLGGRADAKDHTAVPKYPVAGAGAAGGKGEADLALGWFRQETSGVAQVLCEFKDIKSGLDAKQNRKGSTQTPAEQCLNYVRHARRGLFGNEPVQPWWGLVTDMNEFRLYWWDRAPQQYLRFTIRGPRDLFHRHDLLSETADMQFDRFLFWKLFQRDMLISTSGRPALWRLVERQWTKERALEEEFYDHYKAVRERLFNVLKLHNPNFNGSQTELLRTSQKLLDRFIFAFYCEDMGERMLFPPQFIRDHIKKRCIEEYYDTEGDEFWTFFRRLFRAMNDGGKLGQSNVPHINGGLFEDDPLIDSLAIPNHVFAAAGQGTNDASLEADQATLFYLSARYNFAAKGDARDSLSLYTLGRIFEQSITELEYRAGELEGRETIAKVSERKRDGVYYTPEWVVNYLVEETLGPWFADARRAAGYPGDGSPAGAEAVASYESILHRIRIVDPACGSGAFLISAFRRLLQERMAVEREKQLLAGGLGDRAAVDEEARLISDILRNNIYGVDLNPSSVEIAKLALWLHSARAKAPLSSLSHTLRCGNSLIGPDFWTMQARTDELKARTKPFDWQEAFPEVFAQGGFDIVLGNPPYVKLQNMMKVYPEAVAYLQARRGGDTYLSTQTGNFDLYLPFIEKGLRLLAPGGRMAYIAPSLWAVNEYGEGLCGLISRTRQLDRWIDFKSFQVFKEAITYTALQFFTHDSNSHVRIAIAGDGAIGDIDWDDDRLPVPVEEFGPEGGWLMATGEDRALIQKLAAHCLRLDDDAITQDIYQGVKTGADPVFKLKRLGKDEFLCEPSKGDPFTVMLEDELLHPILSGPESKRYLQPETDAYLLFPYTRANGQAELIGVDKMQSDYPLCWAYLLGWKSLLTKRDNGDLDNGGWYQFSRSQGLNRAGVPKLFAAGTVPSLRFSYDSTGEYFLTGGRVDGLVPSNATDPWFLLGVLNGPVADHVFRRIGRPKQGGWFEANKQFIAPLPIPRADAETQAEIGRRARRLQEMWTERRDLLKEAEARLSVLGRARHGAGWLWFDLPKIADLKEKAPKALRAHEKTEWAQQRLAAVEEARLSELQGLIDAGTLFEPSFSDGELRLTTGGRAVAERIFLDPPDGELAVTYWRYLLLKGVPTDAKAFAKALRSVPTGPETPAARQFMERAKALLAVTEEIREAEREMNERLYVLYDLSPDERLLVESDCAGRAAL